MDFLGSLFPEAPKDSRLPGLSPRDHGMMVGDGSWSTGCSLPWGGKSLSWVGESMCHPKGMFRLRRGLEVLLIPDSLCCRLGAWMCQYALQIPPDPWEVEKQLGKQKAYLYLKVFFQVFLGQKAAASQSCSHLGRDVAVLGLAMAPTMASLGTDTGSRGTNEAGEVVSDGNGSREALPSAGTFLVSFACHWALPLPCLLDSHGYRQVYAMEDSNPLAGAVWTAFPCCLAGKTPGIKALPTQWRPQGPWEDRKSVV